METWHNCHLDEANCICLGEGWIVAGPAFAECPIHFEGQLHPDTKALLLDDVKALQEEERKSKIKWKIKSNEETMSSLERKLSSLKEENKKLEMDLIYKATTVKMKAIRVENEPII